VSDITEEQAESLIKEIKFDLENGSKGFYESITKAIEKPLLVMALDQVGNCDELNKLQAAYDDLLKDAQALIEALEFYAQGLNSEHQYPASSGVLGETARLAIDKWKLKHGGDKT